jgi:hypothetical protein
VLPSSKQKDGLGSSKIGRSFGVATKGLIPRVPNSECLESGRLFYNGLETELGLRQKRLDFVFRFLDYDNVFSQTEATHNLHQHDLNQYQILFAPLCLEFSVLIIEGFTQHGVA